jgi:hypothetical protein
MKSQNGSTDWSYDAVYINNNDGGYVYIDVAEVESNVNPALTLRMVANFSDTSVFDSWKDNVIVHYNGDDNDGDPKAALDTVIVKEKDSETSTSTRMVSLIKGNITWSEYQVLKNSTTGTTTTTSTSSTASTSSAAAANSDCHFWEACYDDGGSASSTSTYVPTPTPTPSPTPTPVQDDTCHFWEACATANATSSSSSSQQSSSSSSAAAASDECHFWEDCTSSSSSADKSEEEDEVTGEDVSIDNAVVKDNIADKEYSIMGTFSEYDFNKDGITAASDWVYKDSYGYAQLLGNPPTENNAFGWKDISFSGKLVANWYLFPLGSDVDGDGSQKYDWIIISADSNNKQVYKLSGSTDQGTFRYSEAVNISYDFIDGRSKVKFDALRPGERTE